MNDSRSTLNGLFGTSRNPTIFDLFSRPIAGFEDFMNGVNRINDGEYFRIDLRDAGDHYELKAELPGVRKEDINVNFEEGVLTIGAWFAPDDRTGCIVGNYIAVTVYIFAVRLHVALLEIGSETGHVLVIRENGFSLETVEVVVPQTDEAKQYWQIFLKRSVAEMLIHFVAALEEFFEIIISAA